MEEPIPYITESTHPVPSHEVTSWPEYQQFIKRLGVFDVCQTFKVVITIEAGHLVTIQQSYFAKDAIQ